MKKVFLDTETTGLKPGSIVQLTYIITDFINGKDKVINAKNFFFEVDYVEPKAEEVHGFSVEKLKVLSGGLTFKDVAKEVAEDLRGSILIAHNTAFDYDKFLTVEFDRVGDLNWEPSEVFCTMKHFKEVCKIPSSAKAVKYGTYKNPKLEELMSFLGVNVDDENFQKGLHKLFGDENIGFHDARFDTTGMVACYYRALNMGYTTYNHVA